MGNKVRRTKLEQPAICHCGRTVAEAYDCLGKFGRCFDGWQPAPPKHQPLKGFESLHALEVDA